MLHVWMILTAIAILSLSGLPVGLMPSRSGTGQWLATVLMCLSSVIGLSAITASFKNPMLSTLSLPWFLPWGRFTVALDSISLFFLAPVFIVPTLGSIYGLSYRKQSEYPDNSRRLVFFYGLLAGSMALVVIARDGILFLMAWEMMAMSAYLTATADDDDPEVCRAGWIYLIATHIGTLCLLVMFALWRYATSSFTLNTVQGISAELSGAIFVLCLIGFGFKAGLMPLHVWLPGAHANAPSHVSAVMSGVMLKMGVYGIVRITALLPAVTVWWGSAVLITGAVTAAAAIVFAIGQNDIKRILAYSSIENIGIIFIGLGLALLGRAMNQPEWIILGLGGSMLHVWNHSLFKSLLFFNAGAIIHASHTRNIDQMGGLAKQMPQTTVLFVIGAVAICALPPLNGFAGEWLIYKGLFQTINFDSGPGFFVPAIAVIPLAMVGTLAVACFVRILGAVFLGNSRCEPVDPAHDPSVSMIIPMAAAAAGCICIGLFPVEASEKLDNAVRLWASFPDRTVALTTTASLGWITKMNSIFIVLILMIALALKTRPHTQAIRKSRTWDCGYAKSTARIQYTGSSFGQTLVNLFAFILWPKTYGAAIQNLFPKIEKFRIIVPDTVLDRLVLPAFNAAGRYLLRLRILQQGQTHLYVLYILIIVIILFICGTFGVQS